jgi:hypothetical protein
LDLREVKVTGGWRKLHKQLSFVFGSRDSSVGIATGYGLTAEELEFDFRQGVRDFSLLYIVQTDSGAYPASLSNEYWGLFPQGKAEEA